MRDCSSEGRGRHSPRKRAGFPTHALPLHAWAGQAIPPTPTLQAERRGTHKFHTPLPPHHQGPDCRAHACNTRARTHGRKPVRGYGRKWPEKTGRQEKTTSVVPASWTQCAHVSRLLARSLASFGCPPGSSADLRSLANGLVQPKTAESARGCPFRTAAPLR